MQVECDKRPAGVDVGHDALVVAAEKQTLRTQLLQEKPEVSGGRALHEPLLCAQRHDTTPTQLVTDRFHRPYSLSPLTSGQHCSLFLYGFLSPRSSFVGSAYLADAKARPTSASTKPRSGSADGHRPPRCNGKREAAPQKGDSDPRLECARLRLELERVMADHGQQKDEVVALRALARSLREQVETMQARDKRHPTVVRRLPAAESLELSTDGDAFVAWAPPSPSPSPSSGSFSAACRPPRGHEFFQLDLELDDLRVENESLRRQLRDVRRDRDRLRDEIARQVPRYEMEIVRVTAALESVASQLRDERAQNDAMREELAHYQAQSRMPVRCAESLETTEPSDARAPRWRQRPDAKAMTASHSSSTISSQLHDDLDALGRELRLLHLSLDGTQDPALTNE
ncbi:hypothetical protein P43SY_008009 [Pythium insidiosum]|uniref:Uncharacterized protein n=1 Tax=Pythium insidiosum TaxID=114742 RepID=A0AAD5LQS9_PYTIN|nr:hypothetical protein P43SY_008009 [Pythium insidiosum]